MSKGLRTAQRGLRRLVGISMAKPECAASSEKKIGGTAGRVERGVPFEEMRRLMRVYGPTKCPRKSGAPGGAKVDSVKRKFHRWFPDLDERFERDEDGRYQPRAGHERELRRREGMRSEDGEVLARKRARRRERTRRGSAKANGKGPEAEPAPTPDPPPPRHRDYDI